ncbi:MAG: DUF4252 domain-containing protein [Melioribacter sp.]|nr:DUF4252 domain-containing protein [Melioribacter sp.]
MRTVKVILLFLLFNTQYLSAQQSEIKRDPGYFEFTDLSSLKSGESLSEVYLEETLLKMVAGLAGKEEDGISNILSGLKLVRVQEFMISEKDIDKAGKLIETMDGDLLNKNWVRILKSRNKEGSSNIYVKPAQDGGYGGLVITTLSGKGRAALVNIVGKIDLESIGKLSKQFNLPQVVK